MKPMFRKTKHESTFTFFHILHFLLVDYQVLLFEFQLCQFHIIFDLNAENRCKQSRNQYMFLVSHQIRSFKKSSCLDKSVVSFKKRKFALFFKRSIVRTVRTNNKLLYSHIPHIRVSFKMMCFQFH